MRRGTVIVIVFALVAAAIVGLSRFLQNQPPMEFTVAVNPLAETWLRDAVNRYNDTQPVVNTTQRIQFAISVQDDLSIWQNSPGYTAENHPAAWIPASALSPQYSDRYATVIDSLARTPLVWGGFASRVNVAVAEGDGGFDWASVQNAAETESWASLGGEQGWGFVNLAFAPPNTTMSGLGALFSAAASFHNDPNLGGDVTRDNGFRNWLMPVINSVPNFQTLGADPAAAIASRGPATAAMALLPESLWLHNLNALTASSDGFTFSYPAYQFMLEFPLAAWSENSQITDTERLAVEDLGEWLLAEAQQGRITASGLRPAATEPTASDSMFSAAEAYGILLEPDYGIAVVPPSRSEAAGLVQWFSQQMR